MNQPGRAGYLLTAGRGLSIDASRIAALATNALGMAIDTPLTTPPAAGQPATIIHSDQGVQFGSGAFTQRARDSDLLASMESIGDCYDCEHNLGAA